MRAGSGPSTTSAAAPSARPRALQGLAAGLAVLLAASPCALGFLLGTPELGQAPTTRVGGWSHRCSSPASQRQQHLQQQQPAPLVGPLYVKREGRRGGGGGGGGGNGGQYGRGGGQYGGGRGGGGGSGNRGGGRRRRRAPEAEASKDPEKRLANLNRKLSSIVEVSF